MRIEDVKDIPRSPGIYKFKDKAGKIIYVGKAKDLRNRVGSYFQKNLDPATKTYVLVSNIESIEIIKTLSELEALILEAELIKKHKPKYNIELKDDKSYLYIVLRQEKVELNGKKTTLPQVLAARHQDILPKDITFGPYPDATTTRYVVRQIRKIIPYRDCSLTKFNRYKNLGRPCLYGDIGLCSAPCVGRINPTDYRNLIKKIKKLLAGQSDSLLKSLEKEMTKASKRHDYEKAAEFRDMLQKINYLRQKSTIAQKYISNPYLVDDLRQKALEELKIAIEILPDLPHRIECYDISNISGKDAVGSMVVAINGAIDKREYRKFKIKTKASPDDFHMLREVMYRRLRNDWELPDLFVIDGGKGQVSAVEQMLLEKGVDIPVIGLAKKFETIVYAHEGEYKEINLEPTNEGLKLLQQLRDEAHRFAQSYHHKLRLDSIKNTLKLDK